MAMRKLKQNQQKHKLSQFLKLVDASFKMIARNSIIKLPLFKSKISK